MHIFHYNRRDLVAKAFFDIFKLTAIAGCISGFFPSLNEQMRLVVLCIIGVAGVIGLIACPPPKKET